MIISITIEIVVLGLNEICEDITENLRVKGLSRHHEESDKFIYSEVKLTLWLNV